MPSGKAEPPEFAFKLTVTVSELPDEYVPVATPLLNVSEPNRLVDASPAKLGVKDNVGEDEKLLGSVTVMDGVPIKETDTTPGVPAPTLVPRMDGCVLDMTIVPGCDTDREHDVETAPEKFRLVWADATPVASAISANSFFIVLSFEPTLGVQSVGE